MQKCLKMQLSSKSAPSLWFFIYSNIFGTFTLHVIETQNENEMSNNSRIPKTYELTYAKKIFSQS